MPSYFDSISFNNKEQEALRKILANWNGFEKIPREAILKQIDTRICLDKFFTPKQFSKLSKFEKKRLRKIGEGLTIMMFLELPMPSQNSVRAKLGLRPRGKAKVKSAEVDSDEEWRPYIRRKKKNQPLTKAEIDKRRRWYEQKFLGGKTLKEIIANKGIEGLQNLIDEQKDDAEAEKEGVKKTDKKKEEQKAAVKEKDEAAENRYPKRSVDTVMYEEPEDINDDDFLYCDDCDKLYLGDCPEHGKFQEVKNNLIKLGSPNRATRTCPDGLSIAQSKIRGGGKGVWADKDFPRNAVFGPYEGDEVHRRDIEKLRRLFEGGYAWEIYKKGKLSHYIDGNDVRKSNFLRFINCARNEEEQNLIAYQYQGKIYYRAYKPIKKGMELLVWYGAQYAEHLGIPTEYKKPRESASVVRNPAVLARKDIFQCKECDMLFADEPAFFTHKKSKHIDRSVKKKHACSFCEYSTDLPKDLRRHVLTHTKEKPHKCSECGKSFSRKGDLTRHMNTHTKQQSHTCDICNKSFTQNSDLKRHIRTIHEGARSFVCPECGKDFRDAGDLMQHMKIHTGERAQKCHICDQRFTQASNLKTHIRTHTNEKPYKCTECPAAFTTSSDLSRHVITQHTKRFPHRCHICDKGFLRPGEMNKHIKKHHATDEHDQSK